MDDKLTRVAQQLGLSNENDYNGVMNQLLQSIAKIDE